MEFLTEWLTNIILFILMAIVIDMLLPNSSMQKYAKMVGSGRAAGAYRLIDRECAPISGPH